MARSWRAALKAALEAQSRLEAARDSLEESTSELVYSSHLPDLPKYWHWVWDDDLPFKLKAEADYSGISLVIGRDERALVAVGGLSNDLAPEISARGLTEAAAVLERVYDGKDD